MNANEICYGFDSFLYLFCKTASKNRNQLYYYPEKTLKRIRESQMAVFYEECEKEGILRKNGSSYMLTDKGACAVKSGDTAILSMPYRRAKKRINLLYVDVLI